MTQTLSFVPGTMCDARVWGPVLAALGGWFGVQHVALDAQRTWADMRGVFDACDTGPDGLNLVGFSMGGYFALDHALSRPERVRSLVIIGTSASGLKDSEKAQRRKALDYLAKHTYMGAPPDRIRQFMHPSHHHDHAILDLMGTMDRELGSEVLMAQFRETMERPSLVERLPELAMPALFIAADTDPYASPAEVERMASLAPNVRAVIVKDAGHLVLLEQPQWLAQQIVDFQKSIA